MSVRQRSKEVQGLTCETFQIGKQENMKDLTKETEKTGQKSERKKRGGHK